MEPLRLEALTGKRILVARESARALEPIVRAALSQATQVGIDLTDVDILSPSFFDELLKIAESAFPPRGHVTRLRLTNSSTDLANFGRIAATYQLKMNRRGSTWEVLPKVGRTYPEGT